MTRTAYGEVQAMRWQVETFGFHALSLEVRQHSEVHTATLAAISDGLVLGERQVTNGVTAAEVLETYRAIADIQRRFGPQACQRYVISFTREAQDVYNVLELADFAGLARDAIDVVPLLETADALETADRLLDEILSDARYREHVRARGDHQEVMLGYSNSTKESGAMAAAWLLHGAETKLADAARRHGVRLTLFHGRGGAIGRGGGPMSRAILSSAPHSLDGTLKITEQGEVVADRYANFDIAMRHLAQLTNAVLIASSPGHEQQAKEAQVARQDHPRGAGRTLGPRLPVAGLGGPRRSRPSTSAATPIGELSGLAMGSRPAARGGRRRLAGEAARHPVGLLVVAGTPVPAGLVRAGHRHRGVRAGARSGCDGVAPGALPRVALPDRRHRRHGDGPGQGRPGRGPALREPCAGTGCRPHLGAHPSRIRAHGGGRPAHQRSRARLLDAAPALQRSISLRNPYVDSLSELQVMLLGRLRALPDGTTPSASTCAAWCSSPSAAWPPACRTPASTSPGCRGACVCRLQRAPVAARRCRHRRPDGRG